jgi:hypothetical protein
MPPHPFQDWKTSPVVSAAATISWFWPEQDELTFRIGVVAARRCGAFLAAVPAEEEGPASTVAGEALQGGAGREVDLPDVVGAAQVEVPGPGEEGVGVGVVPDGGDQ